MVKALALLCLPAFVLAQGQYATVTGVVSDATGGLIAGVSLRIHNVETGEVHAAESNESGTYVLPLLKPGHYRLEAEKQGFKRYQQTGIQLETGTPARLDIVFELGSVTDSVTVESSAPLLQSETSTVGAVIENRTIVNMPLIDRRAAQLARLSGFMVQNGTDSQFSMAGGRGNNAMWMVDGGSVQNMSLGTQTLSFDPPVEALQEFNVSISNYAAELGRTGGGVIQMTTKSGTNGFHGSGYGYLRNDALDARSFFAADKPVLSYKLFGGSLGGPIQKDKTHFFYSYEGRRTTDSSPIFHNIPTPAEVTGDFSANAGVIRDPAAAGRPPFAGNRIPASRIDPAGAKLAAYYPAPNVAGSRSGQSNFLTNSEVQSKVNTHVTRLDHVFSERDRMYGRVLINTSGTETLPVYPVAGVDVVHRHQEGSFYNVSGTWFHNLTPVLINELRGTWERRKNISKAGGVGTGLAGKLGIPGTDPNDFPRVTLTAYTGFMQGSNRLQVPIYSSQLVDHLSWVRGNHQIKAGFEYRFAQNDDLNRPRASGEFAFNNVATGNGVASMLLGWVQRARREETLLLRTRSDTYGGFIQDNWKLHSSFTLNIGLRYDLDQPRWEKEGNRQNSFDRAAINPVSGTPGIVTFSGRNGLSRYAHNWDRNNFGPRVGFAWRLHNKWVVRGGGSVVYAGQYDQATPNSLGLGFSLNYDSISPDNGLTPVILLRNGLPAVSAPAESELTPGFGAVRAGSNPTNSVEFLERNNRRNGYLTTLNLNIERQIGTQYLIEVGYLSTLGHKLPAPSSITLNQVPLEMMRAGNAQVRRPFPQYSDVTVLSPAIGNSNYHGMNVKVEKRYSRGLQFQMNYTWARMIDDVESRNEPGGTTGNGYMNAYDRRQDRGLSGWSIAHRLIWSSVYELPLGKGKAGGWSLGYIAELRSGLPYGVNEQVNTTNAFSSSQRPNIVGDPRITVSRSKAERINQWFNTAAFAAPAPFTFGNGGRTNGFGPGAVMMDLSVLKDFHISEGHRLQFRLEMLNFLNHANFGLPNLSRGNANFGRINSLIAGNESRIIQLGLHYRF